MKTFKLDENSDLVIEDGSFVLLEGDEAIAQGITTRLRVVLGECVYNLEYGIDWFNPDYITKEKIPLIYDQIARIILEVDGVKSIHDISLKIENNMLKFNAEIETEKGRLKVNAGLL